MLKTDSGEAWYNTCMTVTLVLNVQRLISHRLNTGRETQESPILDAKEKDNGSHRAFVAPIPFVHE